MVSRNRAEEEQEEQRDERKIRQARWGAAIGGGRRSARSLTAGAAGARGAAADRRHASSATRSSPHPEILVEASDALRDRQYAPTLAANRAALETPFALALEGRRQARRHAGRILTIMPAAIAARSNPDIDRLLAEDKGLRVVYPRIADPRPGQRRRGARRAGGVEGRQVRHVPRRAVRGRATRRPRPSRVAARPPASRRSRSDAADQEAELKRNFQLAGQLGATGTPLFVVGDRVMNSAVGYDGLKKAIAAARAKG